MRNARKGDKQKRIARPQAWTFKNSNEEDDVRPFLGTGDPYLP